MAKIERFYVALY